MGDDSFRPRLYLLGAFRLVSPQGTRVEIVSKKAMALVAMLAMAPDGERTRGWLQEKLWGSREPAHGRSSLRGELSKLRRCLEPISPGLLDVAHDRVRLNLGRLSVDAREHPDDASRVDGSDFAEGEFLEGLDIAGEDGFEAWLREQRRLPRPRLDGSARAASAAPLDERPSIAVLAFECPPDSPDDLLFAEGVVEEIVSGLSRSSLLRVASRQSSLCYEPRGVDVGKCCATLGVDYLVLGSVRRAGARARVSAALVSGTEDRTIWTGRHDRESADLFMVQDDITTSIIGALEPALLGHEGTRPRPKATRNPRHWDLFVRGRWHLWRSQFGQGQEAVDYLKRALALEPDHVPTLSLVALSYLGPVWAGVSKDPVGSIAKAHALALKAVSLDGADAFAHYILGVVLSLMGHLDQAMAEQRRALALNPYLASAAGEIGRLHVFAGRVEEAIAASERAIAASPNDPHAFLWCRNMSLACFIAGRYADAACHAADACARGPQHFFLHFLLAACHAAADDLTQARMALNEGQRLRPEYNIAALSVGHPFADPRHLAGFIGALRAAGWEGA